jgi:fused signal recognition particle receptor
MEIVLGVIALLVVTGIVAAFIANRPRRGSDLDPPLASILPDGGTAAPPKKRRRIPSEEELNRQARELVAEAEAVLAAAHPQPTPEAEPPAEPAAEPPPAVVEAVPDVVPEVVPEPPAPAVKPRFRDRLGKARGLLSGYLGSIRTREKIDGETWDELEEALLRADVGVGATTALLDHLRTRVKAEGITTPDGLVDALKDDLKKQLVMADRSLRFEPGFPNVWLFVGVNGVGKTTTIGKVGAQQAALGRSVLMAAGDTFRAAAVEQLGTWAERSGAQLVRGNEGGDPSAVIFDAIESATARHIDLVLGDTAGRLHTKTNLMEELRKVRRVAAKGAGQVTEVLLVVDATTGQNGLAQAREFGDATEVTGVVLTKLDGSAKGGIVFAIETELGLPVKLIGLGESIGDLVVFDPVEFIDALTRED